MHRYCQHFFSISQLELWSSAVRGSLYETGIDIWTIKNEKRAEFDHRYIFCKFWKYWIVCLLACSYLWRFSICFYRLGLHQLISDLMAILILGYTGWYISKNIWQTSLNFILKFELEYQIGETLLKCLEFLLFSKYHHKLWGQKKSFDNFFLVFHHNDTWMIPKIIDSVCNLVNSGSEIIIITMISKYFEVWNNIDEKFVKNFCYSLIFCNHFLWSYFLLTFLGVNFFLISVILYFIFILSIKNGFTVFQKVLLFVM